MIINLDPGFFCSVALNSCNLGNQFHTASGSEVGSGELASGPDPASQSAWRDGSC